MKRGMVVIGAGECGVRAAFALREQGYDGAITLIGQEIHLPYERPPLSTESMLDPEPPLPKAIATLERMAGAGITLILNSTAIGIERATRTITLSDSASVPYDKLLLATGAKPKRLPLAGADAPPFVYLRTFDDAQKIRRHLSRGQHIAVIGGGFIGLELAASARQRGADVTVIEALPRLLNRGVPEEIAGELQARHEAEGVHVLCGETIEEVHSDADSAFIALRSGMNVMAGLVLIGIGAVPVTQLAAASGLTIDNGIEVDEALQTRDPHIFAAGDCCSFPLAIYGGRRVRLESWRNAQEQGNLAARNMLGAEDVVSGVPWFWTDQYDLTVQIAGLADEGQLTVRRQLSDTAYILFHLAEDGRLVAASGIGAGNAVASEMKLAEMMIARRVRPDRAALADPSAALTSLAAA